MSRRGPIRNVSRLDAVRVFGNLNEIKEGGPQTETGGFSLAKGRRKPYDSWGE